eukprot:5246-Amphidinium_carterae.1
MVFEVADITEAVGDEDLMHRQLSSIYGGEGGGQAFSTMNDSKVIPPDLFGARRPPPSPPKT